MGTLILKMMSGEDLADDDTRKSYSLKYGVKDVDFIRMDAEGEQSGSGCVAVVLFDGEVDPEMFIIYGNCYVMNENGKTITSFGPG